MSNILLKIFNLTVYGCGPCLSILKYMLNKDLYPYCNKNKPAEDFSFSSKYSAESYPRPDSDYAECECRKSKDHGRDKYGRAKNGEA